MMISVSTTFCSSAMPSRPAHALVALELEGLGHDADGQDAQLARGLRDDRRRTGAGAAAHAGGDEAICAPARWSTISSIVLRRRRADFRARARAQTFGDLDTPSGCGAGPLWTASACASVLATTKIDAFQVACRSCC
jgi:hypothetical protein